MNISKIHLERIFGQNLKVDGCRVPMPWDSKSKNFGFSNSESWLPAEKKYKNLCVDIQKQDSNSMLSFTKEQIALRKKSLPSCIAEWKLGQTF